uniref:Uncharacterized protein n=1 Tax=Lepeophtheirus salmonis TaxID=72036 RepID=A0A0K2VAD4_LEPSM
MGRVVGHVLHVGPDKVVQRIQIR